MNDVKEKARAFLSKTGERLKKVSKKVWLVIAAVLVALIVVAAIALTLNKQDYAVLVTQVSDDEASKILTFLSEQGVTNYRVEDGNTVMVPAGQEAALKARILMANLNQTGNYYMENMNAFSTNEERVYAKLQDLQDSMAATIRNFPDVMDADVFITPGENRAYILDSGNVVEATAAVSVTMVEGKMLTDGQAEAIRDLLAHGVQGLKIESVSISDKLGNVYLTEDALNGEVSALKMQLQQAMENRIRTQVMNAPSSERITSGWASPARWKWTAPPRCGTRPSSPSTPRTGPPTERASRAPSGTRPGFPAPATAPSAAWWARRSTATCGRPWRPE